MVELMEMVEMMAGPLDQLVWEDFRQSSFPCVRSASSASKPSRSFCARALFAGTLLALALASWLTSA